MCRGSLELSSFFLLFLDTDSSMASILFIVLSNPVATVGALYGLAWLFSPFFQASKAYRRRLAFAFTVASAFNSTSSKLKASERCELEVK
jgi:hypothetical protein